MSQHNDPTAHVDGTPYTRGEFVSLLDQAIAAFVDDAQRLSRAWHEDRDPVVIVEGSMLGIQTLTGFVTAAAILAAHDDQQAVIDDAVAAFSVPDSL